MNKKDFIQFLAMITIIFCVNPLVLAEEFPIPKVDYSADFSMDMGHTPGGETMKAQGRIFASKGNERREIEMAGQKRIMIKRKDKGVTWMLMPENKTYMETSKDKKENNPESLMREGDITLTKMGKEKVNGVQAVKNAIEAKDKSGIQFNGHLWVTEDNVPVRMEGGQTGDDKSPHFRIDYTNIKIQKQDPSLFEIPEGYDRLAIPKIPAFPGMGGMHGTMPPEGMPPGGITEEEIRKHADQMKKQMEEMMKQLQQRPEGEN